MKTTFKLFMGTSLLMVASLVHASSASASDSYVTFNVAGSFTELLGPTVSLAPNSFITVDITQGDITGADLVAGIPGATFTGAPATDNSPFLGVNGYLWTDSNGDTLGLGLKPLVGPNVLLGYTGGTAYGSLTSTNPFYLGANLTGTLTLTDPPSLTPEPASMFLFGTGLVGIGVLLRRRSSARQL